MQERDGDGLGEDGVTKFKDSGARRAWDTGAVRDAAGNKGRWDLMPFDALQELARVFETGCLKYGDRNWEQGIPVSTYLDSAGRHLAKASAGWIDEPHLSMAMWNIACAIQTTKWVFDGQLPKSLVYDKPLQLCCGLHNPALLEGSIHVKPNPQVVVA
jgi:hypothetical protein